MSKASLRVGFDISQLAHFGGVTTYTQNLANLLAKNPELEMTFFYSSLRRPYKGNLPNVKKFNLPPTFFEVLFNKLHNVPIERFVGEVDIFHSSDWVQPPSRAKKVTTYHDLVPLMYPQWSHPKIIAVNKRRLALAEKEIDMVIAVSESTKTDLLKISKIPAEKIVVIYEGVEEKYKPLPKEKIEAFRQKYNLPAKFVLAIGGIGERRNLKRVKEVCQGFDLIVTRESVSVLNEEMPLLYNSAEVLLYPSFYEGFGLPILEAMACGTPVITSNVSSMPEIAGEAAIMVDPENTEQIKKELKKVMDSKQLRQELAKKGINRAKQFSWQKCATETAAVYQKLIREG